MKIENNVIPDYCVDFNEDEFDREILVQLPPELLIQLFLKSTPKNSSLATSGPFHNKIRR